MDTELFKYVSRILARKKLKSALEKGTMVYYCKEIGGISSFCKVPSSQRISNRFQNKDLIGKI